MGSDSTDSLYQKKLLGLLIQHVPSGQIVEFKAFITGLSDNYSSKWNAQDVYGRMDPIATFQGTRRNINVSWTVPAFSATEAQTNLQRASRFIEMLYPAYSSQGPRYGAGQISAAPLLKVRFANLICNVGMPVQSGIQGGLLGFINGSVSLQPDLNTGFWDEFSEELYPMAFSLGFDFTVLHTHELGWDASAGQFRGNTGDRTFPYGSPSYLESQNKISQLGVGGTSTPAEGPAETLAATVDVTASPTVVPEELEAEIKVINTATVERKLKQSSKKSNTSTQRAIANSNAAAWSSDSPLASVEPFAQTPGRQLEHAGDGQSKAKEEIPVCNPLLSSCDN